MIRWFKNRRKPISVGGSIDLPPPTFDSEKHCLLLPMYPSYTEDLFSDSVMERIHAFAIAEIEKHKVTKKAYQRQKRRQNIISSLIASKHLSFRDHPVSNHPILVIGCGTTGLLTAIALRLGALGSNIPSEYSGFQAILNPYMKFIPPAKLLKSNVADIHIWESKPESMLYNNLDYVYSYENLPDNRLQFSSKSNWKKLCDLLHIETEKVQPFSPSITSFVFDADVTSTIDPDCFLEGGERPSCEFISARRELKIKAALAFQFTILSLAKHLLSNKLLEVPSSFIAVHAAVLLAISMHNTAPQQNLETPESRRLPLEDVASLLFIPSIQTNDMSTNNTDGHCDFCGDKYMDKKTAFRKENDFFNPKEESLVLLNFLNAVHTAVDYDITNLSPFERFDMPTPSSRRRNNGQQTLNSFSVEGMNDALLSRVDFSRGSCGSSGRVACRFQCLRAKLTNVGFAAVYCIFEDISILSRGLDAMLVPTSIFETLYKKLRKWSIKNYQQNLISQNTINDKNSNFQMRIKSEADLNQRLRALANSMGIQTRFEMKVIQIQSRDRLMENPCSTHNIFKHCPQFSKKAGASVLFQDLAALRNDSSVPASGLGSCTTHAVVDTSGGDNILLRKPASNPTFAYWDSEFISWQQIGLHARLPGELLSNPMRMMSLRGTKTSELRQMSISQQLVNNYYWSEEMNRNVPMLSTYPTIQLPDAMVSVVNADGSHTEIPNLNIKDKISSNLRYRNDGGLLKNEKAVEFLRSFWDAGQEAIIVCQLDDDEGSNILLERFKLLDQDKFFFAPVIFERKLLSTTQDVNLRYLFQSLTTCEVVLRQSRILCIILRGYSAHLIYGYDSDILKIAIVSILEICLHLPQEPSLLSLSLRLSTPCLPVSPATTTLANLFTTLSSESLVLRGAGWAWNGGLDGAMAASISSALTLSDRLLGVKMPLSYLLKCGFAGRLQGGWLNENPRFVGGVGYLNPKERRNIIHNGSGLADEESMTEDDLLNENPVELSKYQIDVIIGISERLVEDTIGFFDIKEMDYMLTEISHNDYLNLNSSLQDATQSKFRNLSHTKSQSASFIQTNNNNDSTSVPSLPPSQSLPRQPHEKRFVCMLCRRPHAACLPLDQGPFVPSEKFSALEKPILLHAPAHAIPESANFRWRAHSLCLANCRSFGVYCTRDQKRWWGARAAIESCLRNKCAACLVALPEVENDAREEARRSFYRHGASIKCEANNCANMLHAPCAIELGWMPQSVSVDIPLFSSGGKVKSCYLSRNRALCPQHAEVGRIENEDGGRSIESSSSNKLSIAQLGRLIGSLASSLFRSHVRNSVNSVGQINGSHILNLEGQVRVAFASMHKSHVMYVLSKHIDDFLEETSKSPRESEDIKSLRHHIARLLRDRENTRIILEEQQRMIEQSNPTSSTTSSGEELKNILIKRDAAALIVLEKMTPIEKIRLFGGNNFHPTLYEASYGYVGDIWNGVMLGQFYLLSLALDRLKSVTMLTASISLSQTVLPNQRHLNLNKECPQNMNCPFIFEDDQRGQRKQSEVNHEEGRRNTMTIPRAISKRGRHCTMPENTGNEDAVISQSDVQFTDECEAFDVFQENGERKKQRISKEGEQTVTTIDNHSSAYFELAGSSPGFFDTQDIEGHHDNHISSNYLYVNANYPQELNLEETSVYRDNGDGIFMSATSKNGYQDDNYGINSNETQHVNKTFSVSPFVNRIGLRASKSRGRSQPKNLKPRKWDDDDDNNILRHGVRVIRENSPYKRRSLRRRKRTPSELLPYSDDEEEDGNSSVQPSSTSSVTNASDSPPITESSSVSSGISDSDGEVVTALSSKKSRHTTRKQIHDYDEQNYVAEQEGYLSIYNSENDFIQNKRNILSPNPALPSSYHELNNLQMRIIAPTKKIKNKKILARRSKQDPNAHKHGD